MLEDSGSRWKRGPMSKLVEKKSLNPILLTSTRYVVWSAAWYRGGGERIPYNDRSKAHISEPLVCLVNMLAVALRP